MAVSSTGASCASRLTAMSSIVGLRAKVTRTRADTLPFDKMYFVKKVDEALIPRMLPVCMRLKLTKRTAKTLELLTCDQLQVGGETQGAQASVFSKEPLPDSMPCAKELQAALLQGGEALEKWWVVVPILLSSAKELPDSEVAYNSRLMYLRNRSWREPKNNGIRTPAIPDTSALIVYGEEITPPCMACPLLMEHIAGKCVLGEDTCLPNMGLVHRSQYKKNIAKYRKEIDKDASILADNPDGVGDQGT